MSTVRNKHELHFILLLIFLGLYLAYLTYAPFLYDFILAASAAAIMKPLYHYMQRKNNANNNLSACLCTILLIIIVIGPIALLVTTITNESFATYNFIRDQIQSGNLERMFQIQQHPWLQDATNFISQYIDIKTIDLKGPLADQATRVSLWIYQGGTDLLTSISMLLLHLFFVVLMFFFLIRDSKKIMEEISKFSPISTSNEAILSQKFTDISQAIIRGTFLTAMIQGTLVGIAFAVLGLPGAIFWAFVSTFFALMPLIGTPIIWLPASIILFVSGAYVKGFLLLAFGLLIISTIDNLLRPYLMGNKAHLPGIVIFFAVLGGISVFGAMGIVIGPMITVFLLTLLEMYGHKLKNPGSSGMNDDDTEPVLIA
ncbi:MAG: AI-2E family transporter [Candidatus Abawacabacteria bacterium]|nr:AI-2E family transporter [Candidatus Abawacabacteria bacterium]